MLSGNKPIDADAFSLGEAFAKYYVVPDFQREYVWEEEQVEQLLEDIYSALYGEAGQPTPQAEYFVGSMVLCPYDESPNVFQIIDGQQRMTTFYLVFCAMAATLGALGAQVPDGLRSKLAFADTASTGEDIHRYRLELQYPDSGNLLVDIANANLSERALDTRSMRRLFAAYETVRRFLRDKFREESSDIVRFHGAISHSIKLIQIVTSDLAGSLRVFETINNRGVALSAEDLLKNLLFMHATDQQYDSLKDRWRTLMDTIVERCREKPSRFLRYYILSQHEADAKSVAEGDVYHWFSRHANDNDIGITGTPIEFVDRLIAAARNYFQFTKGRDPSGETVAPLANISRFARSVRQHMIMLMAAQNLSRPLLERLSRGVEELLFCFIITHQPGNRYERLFAQWAPKLRGVADDQSLEQFLSVTVESQKSALAADFAVAFQGLSESNVYPYRLRYILAKLSQHIDLQAWNNPSHQDLSYYDALDVEHILPNNPPDAIRSTFDQPADYDYYAHMLGNLALLEATINRSIKNEPFEAKRLRYPDSHILLTSTIGTLPSEVGNNRLTRAVRNLRSFPTWDSADIRQRQEILAALARDVWAMPAPPTEVTYAPQT